MVGLSNRIWADAIGRSVIEARGSILFCRPALHGLQRGGTLVAMRNFTAVVEKDADTGLYVGYVPGWPGAHSQGSTLDELHQNLEEVLSMLLEDGEPKLTAEFVGTQALQVA
jgi:predicted RNase H-like HicB family nuclease